MKTMSFFIETYGCQMNVADSSGLARLLELNGLKFNDSFTPDTDVVIINTCSVRHSAENRIYGRLGYYKNLKQKQSFILILTGCMAEKEKQNILKIAPHIDFVVGTHNQKLIPGLIKNSSNENVFTGFGNYSFTSSVSDEKFPFRAFVTIIHGCSNFCTYCIVPYVRGREISRNPEEIVSDIENLVKNGVKEIVLLGQNVNSYGINEGHINFSELLKRVDNIPGLKRLRFITSHPKDFSFELIDTLAELKTLCHDIHLPLQSASNKILKLMNRKYTFENYYSKIKYLREKIDSPRITTDLLVGFPGEDEYDYSGTIQAIKDIRFDSAFMYKYSPREGTDAFNIKEEISDEEKQNRLANLINIQNNITEQNLKNRINSIERVLIETVSKNNEREYKGVSGKGYAVVFETENNVPGDIVKVKITGVKGQTLKGKLV
mgnify:CR=1 FL=1